MGKINLNDEQFQDNQKVIFNGGNSGVVTGCSAVVGKKGKDDPDNMPDYRIVFVDENGGEINKGYYYPKDTASSAALNFLVKEMKALVTLFRGTPLAEADSYKEIIDYTMKQCKENESDQKFNVAVAYGTVDYPNKYLQINAYWHIKNVEDNGMPVLGANDLVNQPKPDADPSSGPSTGSEDSTEEEW